MKPREAVLNVTLALGILAAPLASFAQQPGKVWRIGFLGAVFPSYYVRHVEQLRIGLRELGYEEGKNIIIEFRWAEGKNDRLPDMAADLVRLNVDVLVTGGTPATLAAKAATTTIPIVMALSGDAVATGIVASLARPGGNVTGSTYLLPELMSKRLQLLSDDMPRIRRVAVLLTPANRTNVPVLNAMGLAAKALKVELQEFQVRGLNEIESAFSTMAKKGVQGIVVDDDTELTVNARGIADLAVKQRLLSIGRNELVVAGGLMAYGVNAPALFHRAVYFIDRILKGTNPADLPVEQPTKFDLVINLKTAKALRLTIPQSVLIRADEVIR